MKQRRAEAEKPQQSRPISKKLFIMKATLLSAAILTTALVSMTACKKDKSTPPNYAKADDVLAAHAIKTTIIYR